jgi:hypothetical protein
MRSASTRRAACQDRRGAARRRGAVVACLAALGLAIGAAPATAQTPRDGLDAAGRAGVARHIAAEARSLATICDAVPTPPERGTPPDVPAWRGGAVEVPRLNALAAALETRAAQAEPAPSSTPAPPGIASRLAADPGTARRFRDDPVLAAALCAQRRSEFEDWARFLDPAEPLPPAAGPTTLLVVLPDAPAWRRPLPPPAVLPAPPDVVVLRVPVLRPIRPAQIRKRHHHGALRRFHLLERPARPGRVVERIRHAQAKPLDARPGHHHGVVRAQARGWGHQARSPLLGHRR